jgi:hypothetical protein
MIAKENKMTERQIAVQTVADMIDQAKQILKSAEFIAKDHNISFSYESIYEELSDNYDVDWYSSNC